VLQRYPTLTPDQVKAALAATGHPLKTSAGVQLDAGMKTIDLGQVSSKVSDVLSGKISSKQNFAPATGLGSIDAARGSYHLTDPVTGNVLAGEIDLTGAAWDPVAWTTATLSGSTWSGNAWMGSTWSGSSWSGSTWSGSTWSGSTWSGSSWSAGTWTGSTWRGSTWRGSTWRDSSWSGRMWASADLDPLAATGA
jgi:serine protease AprX